MRFRKVPNIPVVFFQIPSLLSKRSMASVSEVGGSDHLQRTKDNTRNEVVSLATVIGLRDESSTVKSLTLKVQDRRLTFQAGQWLDMFIPGVETVGGFSMYSSPIGLTANQELNLAVKYSKYPPAHWVHKQCRVGSEVNIRVGGDFFYDPVTQNHHDLLLIAGGVGINPLFSIINHMADLHMKGDNSNNPGGSGRVILLYSSRTAEELIFKSNLDEIQSRDERLRCQYFITSDPERAAVTSRTSNNISDRRIASDDISKCFDWLEKSKTLTYICGPSPMISDIENVLLLQGIDRRDIHYEKWW